MLRTSYFLTYDGSDTEKVELEDLEEVEMKTN